MINEGSDASRAGTVADVASRLFGAPVGREAVIDESLRRSTDDTLSLAGVSPQLRASVEAPLPDALTDAELRRHPLSVWAELALGFDDGRVLRRKKPIPFGAAARQLADATGLSEVQCADRLEAFLTRVSLPEQARGGDGDKAFLAFKLHRFVAGSGEVYTTLRAAPRNVSLEGQINDPADPEARLYPTRFCRSCGHEYHVVSLSDTDGTPVFLPRSIDDTPLNATDDDDVAGYLTPVRDGDDDFKFTGESESFPDEWLEDHRGSVRLRPNRIKQVPRRLKDGRTLLAHKPEHAVDLDTGAVVAAEMHAADRGDTATLPGTLASAARHLGAVDAAPSTEVPAELVADKGYHSRETLKALDDGPWKTRIRNSPLSIGASRPRQVSVRSSRPL